MYHHTQGAEYTRLGVRDGSYLPGVDLWDEINGDYRSFDGSTPGGCMADCMADPICTAWTFTAAPRGLCRLKQYAQYALQGKREWLYNICVCICVYIYIYIFMEKCTIAKPY